MDAEDAINPLGSAVLDHRQRTRRYLLGGLEAEPQASRPAVTQGHERGRGPKRHCHVAVVAAGMHHTLDCRGDDPVVAALDNRERVHVGAQHQRGTRLATVEICEHAGATDAGSDREAEVGAPPGHKLGGLSLVERELRVPVERAPGFDDFLTGPVGLGAQAGVQVDGDAAHEGRAELTPESRSATAPIDPLLTTRFAPAARARRRRSSSR